MTNDSQKTKEPTNAQVLSHVLKAKLTLAAKTAELLALTEAYDEIRDELDREIIALREEIKTY